LLCLRNARAFPLLPAALASVPFGFVLVRVRVRVLPRGGGSEKGEKKGEGIRWGEKKENKKGGARGED